VLLSNGLADDGVCAPKAMTKEEPFGARHQWCRGHAVGVMGDCEEECACVLPAPLPNETSLILCSTLVVDFAIGTLHGLPQTGEARMKEAQPLHTAIRPVALEDPDPAENLAIWLAVVEDYEADFISSPDQLMAQEDLLTLGSADMCQVLTLGEGCVSFRRDKAH
jgi:hypothetical protein